ncbi:MAG: hypothetical protein FI731_12060 [SAR202 cluster bacterium]|nr:hypothetical protein [SAR202 cluster bacterium]|tara:strand:+ start:1082 stop:1615 length:534 start_codon:yes stop_codon:yes gene_type:complete
MANSQQPTACFIGTRLEALQAVRECCEVKSIVTVADSWVDRDCRRLGGLPFLVTKRSKEAAFDYICQQQVDLVVSAGFPFILPSYVLRSGPAYINSHPSLLPTYKGYNAIRDAFDAREESMGVTVHHMTEELDGGAVIAQESVSVKGLRLEEVFDLLFRVVEPKAIFRSIEALQICV